MNEEVLKILQEKDREYEEPISIEGFDITDILEEEEVEYEFLFPEEYAKKRYSIRNRRSSTYATQTKKELEEDLNLNFYDNHQRDGHLARSRTIELDYNDYKEVNYLKDLLTIKKPKSLSTSIDAYTFPENSDSLIKIESHPYDSYNPPTIDMGHRFISQFATYFDIFSGKVKNEKYSPKWTLETALKYMKAKQTSEQSSPTYQSKTSIEVVRSNVETKECSKVDSDLVDASYSCDKSSFSFLSDNVKTFKQTGNGLPNALAISDKYIVIGMSKSQLMVFPNQCLQSSLLSMSPLESNTTSISIEPFMIGSNVNSNDVGSVLSLSIDMSGTLCAVGYSGGIIDIINLEKRSVMKTISDIHVTALLFVRFLSNNSLLSVDYDGNVNITSFNKKLFSTNANSTRIINRKQYGQFVDISCIPFSLTITHSTGEAQNISVDLIALSTLEQTIILTITNNQANILFTMKRDPIDATSSNDKYDPKTQYINNYISSSFYRNDDNSFLFIRADDSTIDAWIIFTKLDQSNQLKYSIQHYARYTLSSLIYSCFLLSPYHAYCITNQNEVIIVDLQINQIVRSFPFTEKMKFIFGNANKKLQKLMRTEDDNEEEVKGIVINSRVFSNSMFSSYQHAYILCFNQLFVIEETDMEKRYQKYLENNDCLNALFVGENYVASLAKQLEETDETSNNNGDVRIRYYGFMNRLSSLVLQIVEQASLPPEQRLGCAFDVLTRIERIDLIFSSVYSLCSPNSELSTSLFFSILTEYIKAQRVDSIIPSILKEYLDYLYKQSSTEDLVNTEHLLLSLNFSSQIDEVISIVNQYPMLFLLTSLYVNGKGDYISPLHVVYSQIQDAQNLDYFSYYPCIVNDSQSKGLQALYSYFLFLLHTAIFGVTLTGNLLNSLGRVSNQNDCFTFITQPLSSSSSSILHSLLQLYPDFILALIFYALSVRAMAATSAPKQSTIGESDDEDEDEHARATAELASYKVLYTSLATTITTGLINCIQQHDLVTEVEEKLMYILFDLLSEWYIESISSSILLFVFQYLPTHSNMFQREKIQKIIEMYSFDESIIKEVGNCLLSIQCYTEFIHLYEKEKKYNEVLKLLFSRISQCKDDKDIIHNIKGEIESFLASIIQKEREKNPSSMNWIVQQLQSFFIPLIYLDNHLFSYYLLVLAEGDHSVVLSTLQQDENAYYYYLQQFFIPCEIPSMFLPSSLVMNMVTKGMTDLSNEILLQFARILLQKEKRLFLSFIQNNTITPTAAQSLLQLLEEKGLLDSKEIEDIGAVCLLYHFSGKTEESLQSINQTLTHCSKQLAGYLHSLFNIKDLEKPFICLQNASQILFIFSFVFPDATADYTYETLQETYLQECWKKLLYDSTEIISQIRKVLTLKTDMNGNRKIIAGLEMLEKTAAGLLQQVLDILQSKIPLAVLLSCVLNQNSGNTIRDISGIVTKVIQSLQMDIEGFDNFVRIYRGDYNECLHQKVELLKQPVAIRYNTCFTCGKVIQPDEESRIFPCGHIYHEKCSEETCSYCKTSKVSLIGKSVKHELLPIHKRADMNEVKIKKQLSEVERWREFKKKREEVQNGTLCAIYDNMNGHTHDFLKLLEPPALFSSMPDFPDIAPEMLLSEPQIGSLPIKPSMKGDCILLPNP